MSDLNFRPWSRPTRARVNASLSAPLSAPLSALLSALLSMTACVPTLVENPPRDARGDLPRAYAPQAGEVAAPESGGQPADLGRQDDPGRVAWQNHFTHPELRALIEAALQNNQELNIQLQEIIIAQAEVSARRGEYAPRVAGTVGVGADKVGAFTSRGYSDEATGLPAVLGDLSFGLRSSWELDIWGRLQSGAEAANRRFLAAQEGRRFIVTELVAEIARSYFELVALDNAIEVLQRNIDLQTQAYELVKAEKDAGRVTELAVQRFEAELLNNKGRVFDLQQEVVLAENRINFLVGRYPQPVERRAAALDEVLPAQLSSGLPVQMLDNRPDVRKAALELEAAKLDVASARAAFLPALSLEAGVGFQAFDAVHLLATPQSLIANLAGNLVAPLVNRAAIEASYRTANAHQIQVVFDYERTLLQAFTDVVNQLARFKYLAQARERRAQQVEVLARSIDVSNLLFQAARADYVEVLFTRREALDAQMELIELKKRQLLSTVDLYQALGGGWRSPADGPAKSSDRPN